MKNTYTIFFLLLFAPLAAVSAAELSFASTFTDHAVLQRDAAIPVWGSADPDERVTVTFGGQSKTTTADAHGKWSVKLDPMPASAKGLELLVRSAIANRESRISNVVVGDVWLCSGQSNMALGLRGSQNAAEEIAEANHPDVRFFKVETQFAQQPTAGVKGAWKPILPATAGECSAVAYYFATALQPKLGVPIGLLVSASGGTRIETWMQRETLVTLDVSGSLLKQWKEARHCPSAAHNGMIAPLQPYAIRGAIWYQGEANSRRDNNPYGELLSALITDWRRTWGTELPFLFVQIPPYKNHPPEFREIQDSVWRKTPRSALVITTDVGDAETVHPRRKRPVGERLALAARAICYGEQVEYSGPVFKSMSVEGSRAVVSFSHVGGGLMAKGGTLNGFVIAGGDGKFVPAQAMIEGVTVAVTSVKVAKPVAVRYGWEHVPDVNLFNRDGLPAAPFRSDIPANLVPAANFLQNPSFEEKEGKGAAEITERNQVP